jgi:molybdopterin-binding protein
MSLATIISNGLVFKSILLDTPGSSGWLKEGHPVSVMFKESEVVLARPGEFTISFQNRIPAIIRQMERGILLSRITLDAGGREIVSYVTRDSVEQMLLQVGDEVIAMIKTNEIMLAE